MSPAQPFVDLPIAVTVRSDDAGALQLELDVAADLEIPALVAYWSPGAMSDASDRAVFLGAVWGPGMRRFPLPPGATNGGVVTLYSLGWREVVADAPLGGLVDGDTGR